MEAIPADVSLEDGAAVRCGNRRTEAKRGANAKQGDKPMEKRSAFQRIVDLCGYHEFSSCKMRERLKREDYPAEVTERAVRQGIRIGLRNDMHW